MVRVYEDLTKTIGNTPLVKLNRVTKGVHCHSCSQAGVF